MERVKRKTPRTYLRDLTRAEFESRLLGYGFRKVGNALGYWALPLPYQNRHVCEHAGGDSHRERLAWLLRALAQAQNAELDERDRT